MIHRTQLTNIKLGSYFQITPGGPLWVRGTYCRSSKKYIIWKYDDTNHTVNRKGDFMVLAEESDIIPYNTKKAK